MGKELLVVPCAAGEGGVDDGFGIGIGIGIGILDGASSMMLGTKRVMVQGKAGGGSFTAENGPVPIPSGRQVCRRTHRAGPDLW